MKKYLIVGIFLWLMPFESFSQNWVSVDSGFTSYVNQLTFDSVNNKLYAIGYFTVAGGSVNTPNSTAQYNGVKWDTIPVINNSSYIIGSIITYNNKLVFTANDAILSSDGISADTIAVHTNGWVLSLFVNNNDLYAMGVIDSINGVIASRIARYDGTVWRAMDTTTSFTGSINCAAMYNGELYIGGNFLNQTGTIGFVAKWDGTQWQPVGNLSSSFNVNILCLEVYNNKLYAAGYIGTNNGNPLLIHNIASWDGIQWDNVGGGVNFSVKDLQVYNNELYAGGHFFQAGGCPIYSLAKWNGTEWCGLGFNANSTFVNCLAVYNNNLYLGGNFKTVLGDTMNYVTQWNGGNYTDTCGVLTSVSEISNPLSLVTISPNPFNSSTTITFSEEQKNTAINIKDILGNTIQQLTTNNQQLIIDMSAFAKGIYFVNIKTEQGILNKKLIKQ